MGREGFEGEEDREGGKETTLAIVCSSVRRDNAASVSSCCAVFRGVLVKITAITTCREICTSDEGQRTYVREPWAEGMCGPAFLRLRKRFSL